MFYCVQRRFTLPPAYLTFSALTPLLKLRIALMVKGWQSIRW
jgi:hypothetical protein